MSIAIETATWPREPAATRSSRERFATSWALEPGAYIVRGTYTRTVETLTTRPGRGEEAQVRLLNHETTHGEGQLAVAVETRRGGALEVTVEQRTIALHRVRRHLLAGSHNGEGFSVRLEVRSDPEASRLSYVKVTQTERVTQKRVDLSNAFTGEKWHDYLEVRQVTTEESTFTANVRLEAMSLAPQQRDPAGTDNTLRIEIHCAQLAKRP